MKYELTVVLSGKATAAKKKTIKEKVEKLIKILKGKVSKYEDWGKIDLEYKINKDESGNFLHFNLELNTEDIKSFKEKLNLEESVIRYLLVRVK